MGLLTLQKQGIERRWLTNKPTHVVPLDVPPQPLAELPARQADPALSFRDAVAFLGALGDSRTLPRDFRSALAEELLERAKLHLATFGIEGVVERDEDSNEAELVLHAGPDAKQQLSRFVATWDRHRVAVAYAPESLMRQGFGAFARGTSLIGIGHEAVSSGLASGVSVVHESVHIDTKEGTKKGRASPYTGSLKARAKGGMLPGAFQGGYGAYQSIEELRTHARDLRQMVRDLRRDLVRGMSADQRAKAHPHFTGRIRNAMQIALRTGAAVSQAAGYVARGEVRPSFKSSFQDGRTWASVTLHTPRDPEGYVLTVPLVASQGPDDPGNRQLLMEQLGWTSIACSGHLAIFRIVAQCHDMLMKGDAAEAKACADALIDVMAQRHFETAPGIVAESYEELLERFNAFVKR